MLKKYSPEAIDVVNPTISVAVRGGMPCRHDSAHRRCTTPQTIIERLRRSCPIAGCHPTNAVLIVGFYPCFVSDETLSYVPKARPYDAITYIIDISVGLRRPLNIPLQKNIPLRASAPLRELINLCVSYLAPIIRAKGTSLRPPCH